MQVVLVTVDIEDGRIKEATEGLEAFIIPAAKESPGFARGVWWHSLDETVGHGLVAFDTAENAKAMAAQVADAPGEGSVTIRSVDVGEVSAEA